MPVPELLASEEREGASRTYTALVTLRVLFGVNLFHGTCQTTFLLKLGVSGRLSTSHRHDLLEGLSFDQNAFQVRCR